MKSSALGHGERKKLNINPIEFESMSQLGVFLDNIFQLKPRFKTIFAVNKFRIIVELNKLNVEADHAVVFRSLEDIVDYLEEAGCTVPVLFYTDIDLDKKQIFKLQHLKKKHLMFFYTTSLYEVSNFCRMEPLGLKI